MSIRQDTIKKIGKILFVLKESEDWLHLREIGRRTGIHHQTVSEILDKYLNQFILTQNLNDYGLKLKLVKLKDKKVDLKGVLTYLKYMKKIQE
ncbi:MAG: helix-turn-helix domain-containing protein [Candidatus Aenigmatarchaeota archaeon]|nr:MarR family transcriptional regulator [Candidatus Aenigmarchaeota archaeon]